MFYYISHVATKNTVRPIIFLRLLNHMNRSYQIAKTRKYEILFVWCNIIVTITRDNTYAHTYRYTYTRVFIESTDAFNYLFNDLLCEILVEIRNLDVKDHPTKYIKQRVYDTL